MILFAIAALLLPGLLVSGLVPYPQRDPLCWLATLLCAALGSWITLFWVIRIVPLSLTQLFAVVAGAALVGVVVRRRVLFDLVTKRLDWRGPHALALVTLGIVVLVRFVPLLFTAVAPGADMSMHSYIARLIVGYTRMAHMGSTRLLIQQIQPSASDGVAPRFTNETCRSPRWGAEGRDLEHAHAAAKA